MGNFNDFMFAKTLDQLAEKCIRENLPIVEFVQWYEEEGQYLDKVTQENVFGNMAQGALAGGGYGSFLGPWGTAAGAGIGALYGAGKSLYDRYSQPRPGFEVSKQQAIDALSKFATVSGRPDLLNKIVRYLGKIGPKGPEQQPKGPEQPQNMDMSKLSGAGHTAPPASAAQEPGGEPGGG